VGATDHQLLLRDRFYLSRVESFSSPDVSGPVFYMALRGSDESRLPDMANGKRSARGHARLPRPVDRILIRSVDSASSLVAGSDAVGDQRISDPFLTAFLALLFAVGGPLGNDTS